MEWRTITGLALAAALTTGCSCAAVANHHRQLLCHEPAQPIKTAADIAGALSSAANKPVGCFANAIGFFTTRFKRWGVRGWRDLHYDGEVTGMVAQQPVKSTDQFLTVNLKIETLQIGGQDFSRNAAGRYLRAEICLRDVKLQHVQWPANGTRAWIRGRLVWDCDGFVEIHPRSKDDVR